MYQKENTLSSLTGWHGCCEVLRCVGCRLGSLCSAGGGWGLDEVLAVGHAVGSMGIMMQSCCWMWLV